MKRLAILSVSLLACVKAESYSLVASTNTAALIGVTNITTAAINTTGATLIVAACAWYNGTYGGPCTVTDSASNSWQQRTAIVGGGTVHADVQASYVFAPTTNASHTFTGTTGSDSNSFVSIWVLAFSGTLNTASVFDVDCGTTSTTSPLATCLSNLTPAQTGELLVDFIDTNNATGALSFSIDNSFTIVGSVTSPDGATEGGADAWLSYGSVSGINPNWTVTGTESQFAATLLAFKPVATATAKQPGMFNVNGGMFTVKGGAVTIK